MLISRNVAYVYTCSNRFEINCGYSDFVDNITMEELLWEFALKPCAFSHNLV